MLTKKHRVDRIEIVQNNIIQVRLACDIVEDDTILSSSYSRFVLTPGDAVVTRVKNNAAMLSDEDKQKIIDIAFLLYTPEVIEEWEKTQNNSRIDL